jgi:hypothetical protein
MKTYEELKQDLYAYFRSRLGHDLAGSVQNMPAPPEELVRLTTSLSTGFISAGFLGALIGGSRQAKLFRVEHEHLLPFKTRRDAFHYMRERNYQIMFNAMKYGWKYGTLGLLFFGLYSGTELAVTLWRHKKDAWNTMMAGSVAGLLLGLTSSAYRFQNILRGGLLGSILGLTCGSAEQLAYILSSGDNASSCEKPNLQSNSPSIDKPRATDELIDPSQALLDYLRKELDTK